MRIVLEYMDRGSIRDLSRISKKISEENLAIIALQALNGLCYLHIVIRRAHLDIKPENLLLNGKGEIKISDFGIAREFNNSHDFMKTFIGTYAYMSPERMSNQNYNHISDIWSLGITLVELAIGEYPLPRSKQFIEVHQFLASTKVFRFLEGKGFSSNFEDFIDKMTIKDPKERWTSVQLLAHPFIITNLDKVPKYMEWISEKCPIIKN